MSLIKATAKNEIDKLVGSIKFLLDNKHDFKQVEKAL